MKRWLAFVLSAGFALVVTACGSPAPTPAGGGVAETDPSTDDGAPRDLRPAPDFELATFEGDTFRLSDHRGQLPVVLNFWAPW